MAATALLSFAAPRPFHGRARFYQRLVMALLFLCFVHVRSGPKGLGVLVFPLVLIVLLGNRLTRDCPHCGAVVYNPRPFSRANYCYACGTALNPPDLRSR